MALTITKIRQAITGAVNRLITDKVNEALSVKDFGAVGDGVTNDTAAVQAALNAAIAAKKALFFSDGVYLLTGAAGSDTYLNGVLVPFSQVNADPAAQVLIYGEGRTRLLCGSDNMILLRISRNCVTVRDIVLDYNGRTGVILCGIVPESVTQTTTLVSQSFITLDCVNRVGGAGVDGIVIQPGPQVGGSDSGCFYHNIRDGESNFVGGGRHVYLKKGATWATDANRPTRTNFYGQRLTRGNAGFHLEVGSEVNLFGCHEEGISSGVSPLATPTARYVSADCNNINFFGGYSEACTLGVNALATNIVSSYAYPATSGSDSTWISNVKAYGDTNDDSRAWTPAVNSTGGGAQGAATSTGKVTKIGKTVLLSAQISAAKGTLAAGSISISGLPYVASAAWTGAGFQTIPAVRFSGITLGANYGGLHATISGATLNIFKQHIQGAGPLALTVAECSDPIVITIQGSYEAA